MSQESQELDLSVVVPLFNEEGNVRELHRKISEACRKTGLIFEIVFVDDGSTDKTLEICRELSPLKTVSFRKNFGQTAAFDAGIKNSSGRIIVTLDGDLQNDPADIPLLLEKMKEGFDVVSGWRHRRKDSFSKKLFSRTANLLRKIFIRDNIHDSGCSLKAYRRECFSGLDLFGEMHRFIPAVLEMEGYRVGEVKVDHHPRKSGKTKYNWKRGVKGFIDILSVWFWRKYANRPLHLFGGAGMIFSFSGIVVLLWMAYVRILLDQSISDKIWPLVGVFLIVVGIQLFVSGILADIAVKSYYRSGKRMNYSVKEILEKN